MCDVRRRFTSLYVRFIYLLRFIDSFWIQFIIWIFVWRQEIGNEINHELFVECGWITATVWWWSDLFHVSFNEHICIQLIQKLWTCRKKSLLNDESPLETNFFYSFHFNFELHNCNLSARFGPCTWFVWFEHQFIKPSAIDGFVLFSKSFPFNRCSIVSMLYIPIKEETMRAHHTWAKPWWPMAQSAPLLKWKRFIKIHHFIKIQKTKKTRSSQPRQRKKRWAWRTDAQVDFRSISIVHTYQQIINKIRYNVKK